MGIHEGGAREHDVIERYQISVISLVGGHIGIMLESDGDKPVAYRMETRRDVDEVISMLAEMRDDVLPVDTSHRMN